MVYLLRPRAGKEKIQCAGNHQLLSSVGLVFSFSSLEQR